jgi:16S rRNA (uracil1498-N3)-methyltransferase
MKRFYVSGIQSGDFSLPPAEAHHASQVVRIRTGDEVELFDGCGTSALAEVRSVGRHEVTLHVGEVQHDVIGEPRVHLAFAVPKGKRLDWLLEKATELEAASLTPVICQRSVAGGDSLTAGKRKRWKNHLIAAAKQCGLNHLPELIDPMPLDQASLLPEGMIGLFGDLSEATIPLRDAVSSRPADAEIILFVGPEGGFTDAERQGLTEAGWQAVKLGESVLRIETAAIALLAATQAMV